MKIHNKSTATLLDSMGDDLRVANVARVSFNKWKDEFDGKDERLIGYLARNLHWTPFGHVMITMRLQMPISIARQWIKSDAGCNRNTNGTENEVSRRYVDTEPEFYIPDSFHARPEGGIKQGSGEKFYKSESVKENAIAICRDLLSFYNQNIEDGLAPEEARLFLPQNAMTTIVETGSLAYYARVCKLRLDSHAQRGIQQLAAEVASIVENVAPISWFALMGESK